MTRHSDINLTLSRYTHTVLGDRANALEALPDPDEGESDAAQHRATATYGGGSPIGLGVAQEQVEQTPRETSLFERLPRYE